MLYSYIVEKEIRKTFDHVNNHRWDEALKAVASHVHHRVSGAHALGGERHDKKALRRWFERLGRVLPTLQITVNNIWVTGWPWHTTVFAQWDAPQRCSTATFRTSTWSPRVHPAVGQSLCTRGISRFTGSGSWACRPSGSWLRRSRGRTDCELAVAQPGAHAFKVSAGHLRSHVTTCAPLRDLRGARAIYADGASASPQRPKPVGTPTACPRPSLNVCGHSGTLHQILRADAIKAALPEQAACHVDHGLAVFRSPRHTHRASTFRLHTTSIRAIEFERNLF